MFEKMNDKPDSFGERLSSIQLQQNVDPEKEEERRKMERGANKFKPQGEQETV